MFEVKIKDATEAMGDVLMLKWFKQEGDEVKAGEEIGEVETEKADITLIAETDGWISEILVKEGELVNTNSIFCILSPMSK